MALTEQSENVDAELEVALAQDQEWAAAAERLQTITGIGLPGTTWLLVTTLNFTLCQSAEALTSYAGWHPVP